MTAYEGTQQRQAQLASPWPFTRPVLMAGLRRYLVAPRLRLLDIDPMPLPRVLPGSAPDPLSSLRGMSVGVEIDGVARRLALVLKEAPVSQGGRVLSAVGKREYGVYRRLAPHLPLLVPALVAGDPAQGWIVVEALRGLRPPDKWSRRNYVEAITNLAALHDRFWGLGEDLAVFAWLGRPLDADYEQTIVAAAESVQALVLEERIEALSTPRNFLAFGVLVQYADEVAAPLREQTYTLLHGDYWPGNIAQPFDGRQIVFDWQRAGIGPPIIDMAAFVQETRMRLEPALSLDEAITLYREEMTYRVAPGWDDERFGVLWDHALLWLFLTQWLGRLARMTPVDYAELPASFEQVWLVPLVETLQRRFGVSFPTG
ncbi:MAG: aminoglycoside phosphotransferase family protein [Anaerolineae bacterium]|nr:aminoglycoside phosphotransferase family protein [Anaerolineae bacterium]